MAKETKEDLKLLSSLEDVLSEKISERLKGAKESNNLRKELLNTLRTEKDLTDGLISQFETYKELMTDVVETSDKSKVILDDNTNKISKIIELEKERKVGQQAIEDSLNKQVDSLVSMVGNIPFIGDSLKEAIDVDSLKDTVSSISESFTQGFSKAGLESGNLVDKMKGGFSAVTGNIGELANGISFATVKQGILNAVASINPYVLIIASVVALIALIKKLVSLGLEFNQNTTNLAKDLGVSVDEARDMEESFNQISGSSKNLSTTTKKLIEAQKQLSSATGITSQFSTQMLEDQIKLTKYMGLSGDEAANFQKIAISNGQNARELQGEIAGSVEEFNNATGASVSLKDVVQDIAKLPADIRVGFKGTTAELAQTVALARTMGTTLEESVAAAEKTLDIESSLKAEAKARVLTGVNINNNAIRAAQIAGDQKKVLELQREQLAEIDNFNEMAPYQQKAIADAMGMTVDQVVKQKEQMALAAKAGIDLEKASIAQIEANSNLSDEEKEKLIKQHEQMSAQEKLSAMQEKFGDLINSIVAGPLGEMVGLIVDSLIPAFDVIMAVLNPIFSIIGFIFKVFVGINKIVMAVGGYIRSLFYPIFEAIGEAVENIKKPFQDLFANFNSGEGSKFMDGLKETGKFLLDYVFTPLKMIIGFVSSVIGGIGKAIATAITDRIQDVMDIFSGIGMILDGDIMGGLKMIGSSIIDILLSPLKLFANLLISVFNGVIGGINAISFDVPSWVPVIGGTTFTPGIPEIPQLAEGGIVESSTIAEVGEAGAEAVVPLDKFFSKLDEMVSAVNELKSQPIVITVDGKVVSEITRVQSKQASFRK